jgi:hypothetical protein
MATRYAPLNLFHATALAGAEGKQLLPDSVLKIRDQADVQKRQKARKLLQDFFALNCGSAMATSSVSVGKAHCGLSTLILIP